MTILPVLVFVGAVGCLIAFECIHAFLDRRWVIPMDKEIWVLIYWVALVMLGVLSKLIPFMRSGFAYWLPLFFVMLVHLFIANESFGPCRQKPAPPPTNSHADLTRLSLHNPPPASSSGSRRRQEDPHAPDHQ